MDSGHIVSLIGAFATIAFSVFSSVGFYLLNIGEQALQTPWAQQTYQEIIDTSRTISTTSVTTQLNGLEKSIGNIVNEATSTNSFQFLIPDLSSSSVSDISKQITSPAQSALQSTPRQSPTAKTQLTTKPVAKASTQPAPVTQPVTQDVSGLSAPFNSILASTEDAVVNILCTSQSGNLITVSTGSGVIVDPKGIILTNSHVAQDLLFTDPSKTPVKDCTIRQGHLIASLYKASVLYIPLSWAQANQGLDENAVPQGNGTGDYALLYITKDATGGSLPSSFPFISPITSYRNPQGESVLAIGYPAESIQGSLQAGVPEKYALTDIANTFTLSGSSADIFQTKANPVAQRGSSGGAIVDKSGSLLGLIVSVENPSISDGSEGLEAISVPYIFQNFASAGISLGALAANPAAVAANFAPTGATIRNLVQ